MDSIDLENGLIVRPLEAFGSSCDWMRAQLKLRQIKLHSESALAKGMNSLEAFRARTLRGEIFKYASSEETYEAMAEVYGTDFVTKAIHSGAASGFEPTAQYWKYLTSSDPIITRSVATSTKDRKDRNLTWEATIASLASTFATEVAFEEPDITCLFQDRRYAIAAKVAYSSANLVENIEKGFHQALASRRLGGRAADAVVVFVDVVSLYPQVCMLRESKCRNYPTGRAAQDIILPSIARWCSKYPLERVAKRLREQSDVPVGVAFFFPLVVFVGDQPTPMFYTHMPLQWAPDSPDYAFAAAFTESCNSVLGFAAG